MSWTMNIELLSETAFGSGYSTPGVVDQEVVYDAYGFPYCGSRALKGLWRVQTAFAAECLSASCMSSSRQSELLEIVEHCFGQPSWSDSFQGVVRIEDAVIPHEVRKPLIHAIREGALSAEEILDAMTEVRYFTSIDNETGTVEAGSLRKFRMIRKGTVLRASLTGMDDLRAHEIGLLSAGTMSLQNMGTMKHRGKGGVRCSLLREQEDVTEHYLNRLREWVSGE